jgi:aryl-alcohol dehydrogenase-like predicted oxidoreductase
VTGSERDRQNQLHNREDALMEFRRLGMRGPEVSVLGLGAWPLGGGLGAVSDDNAIATIHFAIDSGITLIDTAQAYRTSEATLGKALASGYRDRVFLATKASQDFSATGIRSAMEDSLRALNVDYVDLYQLHRWDTTVPVEESMETMAQLQEEGKTRYIGVSNFSAAQMARAWQASPFQSNQPRYSMFFREVEAVDVPLCENYGIGILAHSPLAKGLLTGSYRPGHQFAEDDERSGFSQFRGELFAAYIKTADQLAAVAADKGLSMVQLALAWVLRLPAITCALVGAKNPSQVEEQLGAVGVTFSDEELARIETILAGTPHSETA